jgi:acyl-CoA synthetase (AMP-forming)/AMP-acid ligase II
VVERYDPAGTPAFFASQGMTLLAGGTPMAVLTLEAQRRQPERRLYPDLRIVFAGAAPKPPGLHAAVRRELGGRGAVSVYGLTEAPLAAVSSLTAPDDVLATCEGTANLGAELRIVDVETGDESAPGVVGEIRVRGQVATKGFLDPGRDQESFDADGFLRTGDLGSLDAGGNLTVSGRLKDVIIRKGENISAKEVEDVLFEHSSIAEVAVFGLPDEERGERCCAAVVLRRDAEPIDLVEIGEFCRANGLAVQKVPEQLEVVEVLPRNASGKVLKHELQEAYTR